jgi:1-acyl-sn-glycerol-3-phosphate acyltransferase
MNAFHKLRRIFSWIAYALVFSVLWIMVPRILRAFSVPIWRFSRLSSYLGLLAFGIRVKSFGQNQVEANKNYICLANHSSWFDQMALCVALPMPLHFLANEKYFQMPLLKYAMRLYEHIPVHFSTQKNANESLLASLCSLLKNGKTVAAFPEATRASGATLLPFKKGMFKIAATSGIPILPVYILGTEVIFPKKSRLLAVKSGTIDIILGAAKTMGPNSWVEDSDQFEHQFRISLAEHRQARAKP